LGLRPSGFDPTGRVQGSEVQGYGVQVRFRLSNLFLNTERNTININCYSGAESGCLKTVSLGDELPFDLKKTSMI
jgi:hypothetical protein